MDNTKKYDNRELSWIKFNERVLGEAEDREQPLMERVRFLGITASNLDEFFMVRVASLKDMVHADYSKEDFTGMTPKEQLEAIYQESHHFVDRQYDLWKRTLSGQLAEAGMRFLSYEETTDEEKEYLRRYFHEEIYPVLTPMAIDSSRPFPLIHNNTLNIIAMIGSDYATVQVPGVLPRLVKLPGKKKKRRILLLEDVITVHLPELFHNHEILCSGSFRIMRNADLNIDEEDASDLLLKIEKQLKKRQWGEVIRFDYDKHMDPRLLVYLKKQFRIQKHDMYAIDGPLDLSVLLKCYNLKGFKAYKKKKFHPYSICGIMEDEDIFSQIRKRDILLHHPYDSFDPVVEFIEKASNHKDVLAIKQTLYRVSGNSPIIKALSHAAEQGKQVTVLVELKARFEEEKNIRWAKKLEKAGVHVIYGLPGLKTHCKIALVVKKEEDGIRRYVHMGTGNYNDITATQYTDFGLFTCKRSMGEDATELFNMLSGYSQPLGWNHLIVAPDHMKEKLLSMIQRERAFAKSGEKAYIIGKCNALCDQDIMEAFYEASQEGVKIQLMVRGICCLLPNRKGLSENIEVHSTVGNYLEHARAYLFGNGGKEEIYLGSADLMPRNMERRVEILYPILDIRIKSQIRHILQIQWKDHRKAYHMNADGTYERVLHTTDNLIDAQAYFCQEAIWKEQRRRDNETEENHDLYPALSKLDSDGGLWKE